MSYECGFYAVNGRHCVINDHCVVCKATDAPQLAKSEVITLPDGPLAGTYKVKGIQDGKLALEFLNG